MYLDPSPVMVQQNPDPNMLHVIMANVLLAFIQFAFMMLNFYILYRFLKNQKENVSFFPSNLFMFYF